MKKAPAYLRTQEKEGLRSVEEDWRKGHKLIEQPDLELSANPKAHVLGKESLLPKLLSKYHLVKMSTRDILQMEKFQMNNQRGGIQRTVRNCPVLLSACLQVSKMK